MPPKMSTEEATRRRVTSSARKITPMQAVTGGMASWTTAETTSEGKSIFAHDRGGKVAAA